MVVSVNHDWQNISSDAINLIRIEARFFCHVLAAWVDDDFFIRSKVSNAVLNTASPLRHSLNFGNAMTLKVRDGLGASTVGSDGMAIAPFNIQLPAIGLPVKYSLVL
jgi:hypothetical protein